MLKRAVRTIAHIFRVLIGRIRRRFWPQRKKYWTGEVFYD